MKKYLPLFVLSVVFSCSEQAAQHVPLEANLVQDVDLYDFFRVEDSLLVGYDPFDTLQCKVFIDEGDHFRLKGAFIRNGNGPGEFLSPHFKVEGHKLFVIENGVYDSHTLSIFDLLDHPGYRLKESMTIPLDATQSLVFSFVPLDKSQMIVVKSNTEGRIMYVFDWEHRTIRPLDFAVEDDFKGSPEVKSIIYTANSNLYFNRHLSKLAYSCGEAGRYLETMDYKDGMLSNRTPILDVLPRYTGRVWNGFNMPKRLKTDPGGLHTFMTDQFIYVMYNNPVDPGKTFNGHPWYFSDIIDVFDWEGDKVRSWITDRPFSTFAVSDDNASLYTLSMDLKSGETLLCRYPTGL